MKEKIITINGSEYYSNHFCKTCGKNIRYGKHHKYYGIPTYCNGHYQLKYYNKEKLITINGIEYYANHFCEYCGKNIRFRKSHPKNGIPCYCNGHEPNSLKAIKKFSYKKGKEHPFYGRSQRGKLNENYIDGYSRQRHACKRRDLGFIPMNEKTKINNTMHHMGERLIAFIPRKIHRSFYHSIKTGYNLKLMNRLAYQILFGFDVGKL